MPRIVVCGGGGGAPWGHTINTRRGERAGASSDAFDFHPGGDR
jgi:hypothetical protein